MVGSPEETRELVLEQHRSLEESLETLEEAALGFLHEGSGSTAELAAPFGTFLKQLEAHMHFEEEQLIPVLQDIDAWGEERVRRFREEHRKQYRVLESAAVDPAKADAEALALLVLGLVQWLRADMREEERSFLDADLLRDDTVTIPEAE